MHNIRETKLWRSNCSKTPATYTSFFVTKNTTFFIESLAASCISVTGEFNAYMYKIHLLARSSLWEVKCFRLLHVKLYTHKQFRASQKGWLTEDHFLTKQNSKMLKYIFVPFTTTLATKKHRSFLWQSYKKWLKVSALQVRKLFTLYNTVKILSFAWTM